MSTATLIRRAHEAGVSLTLNGEKIKIRGKASAVLALTPELREHKADLLLWLQEAEKKQSTVPLSVLQEEYRLYTRLAPPTPQPAPQPQPEPPTDPEAWRELAQAYNLHHFACKTCCAAGQGRGLRCGVGSALFTQYQTSI